jgi:DNA-directed RNA polymerase subunit RPC12/RpoP
MGFWKRLFGVRKPRSGGEGLALLLNHLAETSTSPEVGGTKLALILNNMTGDGGGNLGMFLASAPMDQIKQLARWIAAASDSELIQAAKYISTANVYQLVNLLDWLQDVGAKVQTRGSPKPTRTAEKPAYSAVREAVVSGRARDVESLIRQGFDVNSSNEQGEVMLLHALCMGDARLDIAELLVAHGANVNATIHGKTLLGFIRDPVYRDNKRTIAFLLQHGASEGEDSARDNASSGPKAKQEGDSNMIRFQCAACMKRLMILSRGVGKRIQCPKCGHQMLVPRAGGNEDNSPARSAAGVTTSENRPIDDLRIARAIESVMGHIKVSQGLVEVVGIGSTGPLMRAVELFRELHEDYPGNASLHYAYAAALQVAGQGATALTVLRKCVETHPGFWIADLTLRRNSLAGWIPFLLPEFSPTIKAPVHAVIHETVRTNILLPVRRRLLPESVLFFRDTCDELDAGKLDKCKAEFMTTISEVTDPQIVAINGRLHDGPDNPYQLEVTQCPFVPLTTRERLVYELFVRQDSFDLVILDTVGKIKHVRRITPSVRMKSAHDKLMRMFDLTEGRELSTQEIITAMRKHQLVCNPGSITY